MAGGGFITFRVEHDEVSSLYSVQPDGSGLTELVADAAWIAPLEWSSPTANKIVVRMQDADRIAQGDYRAIVLVMNPDGTKRMDLPAGLYVMGFSPDGTRMLVGTDDDPNSLFAMNTDGSGQVLLLEDIPHLSSASFSPDGSKVVVVSWTEEEGGYVVVVNDDGTGTTTLLQQPANVVAYLPEGNRVLLLVYELRGESWKRTQLRLAYLDGSGDTEILAAGEGETLWPVRSHDPSRIVVRTTNLESKTTRCTIMNLDGTNRSDTPLYQGTVICNLIPGERKLLLHGTAGDDDFIALSNLDGTDEQTIWTRSTEAGFVSVSPITVKSLLLQTTEGFEEPLRWTISLLNVADGSIADLAGGEHPSVTFSPDGQWFVFASDHEGAPAIYRARVDGTGITKLADGGSRPIWHPTRREVLGW